MPKHSKDAGLQALANQLATLRWFTELTVAERDIVIASPGKNVYCMPDGITRAIRVYLGGAVRTFGITRNPGNAFRFADLVLHRFWKYRQRGCKPPGPGELNLSTARLQADLANEKLAIELLDKIEQYLLANAALVEKSATAARPSRSRVAELTAALAQANGRIDELTKTIQYFRNRFDALDNRIDEIAPRVTALEAGAARAEINHPQVINLPAGALGDITC